MKKQIRIKQYFHLLERDRMVEFIRTLDEGITVPAGDFFNGFLETMQNLSDEDEIVLQLMQKFSLNEDLARQMVQKFLELGILEYYQTDFPPAINRYHRQLLLFDTINPQQNFEENFKIQQKLARAHVMIIGIGGIGNFIAMSLVAAGIGEITLVDFDLVEETNLNRQMLFTENDLGKSKILAAQKRLNELNSSCKINTLDRQIFSRNDFENLIKESKGTNYVILSADKPNDLVLWASALCKKYIFKYMKCGYMAYQGLIGPLLGYDTKAYEDLFHSWAGDINTQNELIKSHNENHIAPSMAASNSILANIAALELIKDITGVTTSALIEKRLLFNLKTMEMVYG